MYAADRRFCNFLLECRRLKTPYTPRPPIPPPLTLLQKPVSNFLVKVIPGELASETKLTPWRLLAEVVPKTRTPGDLDSEVELKFAISINENVNSVSSKIKSSLVPGEDVETSIR